MKKSEVCFVVVTDNKEVVKIGRSFMTHPTIRYKGNGIKWFDDNLLLKSRK